MSCFLPTPRLPPLNQDWEPGDLCPHISCSLIHGERMGTEFIRRARTLSLPSGLVMRDDWSGCLGFPKVVLGRSKREHFREILSGICFRPVEQPPLLRDGRDGSNHHLQIIRSCVGFSMYLGNNGAVIPPQAPLSSHPGKPPEQASMNQGFGCPP